MSAVHSSPMCAYGFSLIRRVELIPTHYCKCAITQCIIILCGWEEHANQLPPRRQATLQLSCITRCYKRNKLGQKFAGKDSAAWGGNTPKEFKDSVPKFMMAFRPATDIWKVSHPLWVASLQKKPRRELTAIQQQFVQILFFFQGKCYVYCPVICTDARLILTCPKENDSTC